MSTSSPRAKVFSASERADLIVAYAEIVREREAASTIKPAQSEPVSVGGRGKVGVASQVARDLGLGLGKATVNRALARTRLAQGRGRGNGGGRGMGPPPGLTRGRGPDGMGPPGLRRRWGGAAWVPPGRGRRRGPPPGRGWRRWN